MMTKLLFALAPVLMLAPQSALGQTYDPALTPQVGDAGVTVEEEWHPNGQIAKRSFSRNGALEGLFQEWHPDGSLKLVAEWRNGLAEGVWMYFHPSGIVSERSYVTRDIWHGPSEGWHANGTKAFEGIFAMGHRASPFRYWDERGNPIGPAAELLPGGVAPEPVLTDFWPAGFNPWDVTLSTDLQTLFVGTGDADGNDRRILMRTWTRAGWSDLAPAPFGDPAASEGTPVMSHDGRFLYFSSDRHARDEPDNPRRELYRVSRQGGWRDVERITNTPAYGEVSLTTAAGNIGVLWTDRQLDDDTRIGLYEVVLDDENARLEIVRSLNDLHPKDTSGEAYPILAPDGSLLLFSNYDLGGQGTAEDMYLSRRVDGEWQAPVYLKTPFSSAGNDSAVQFVGDGATLLFTQSTPDGTTFYSVPTEALLQPGRIGREPAPDTARR